LVKGSEFNSANEIGVADIWRNICFRAKKLCEYIRKKVIEEKDKYKKIILVDYLLIIYQLFNLILGFMIT
jgi:hypothetical protein